MSPTKGIQAQIEAMIEADIDFWTDQKQRDAEQMESDEE